MPFARASFCAARYALASCSRFLTSACFQASFSGWLNRDGGRTAGERDRLLGRRSLSSSLTFSFSRSSSRTRSRSRLRSRLSRSVRSLDRERLRSRRPSRSGERERSRRSVLGRGERLRSRTSRRLERLLSLLSSVLAVRGRERLRSRRSIRGRDLLRSLRSSFRSSRRSSLRSSLLSRSLDRLLLRERLRSRCFGDRDRSSLRLRSLSLDRLRSLTRRVREARDGLLDFRRSGLGSGSFVSAGGLGSLDSLESLVTRAFLASAGLTSVAFGVDR